jgi:hypothetical protein
MPDALSAMLARYELRSREDALHALREIIQEVALLGLWRAKFFDRAAFYGGTALRVLHGLERFSEDLDFSLLGPDAGYDLGTVMALLQREVEAFGFSLQAEMVRKTAESPIRSAFLKGNTRKQLLTLRPSADLIDGIAPGQVVKVRIEVDVDPPGGFATETRFLLLPIPFAVRAFALPDLFAGKMHAVLCRRWRNRVKGRDWYDFVWFSGHHPELRLSHLEQRMRQTGDWTGDRPLDQASFNRLLDERIRTLDVGQAKREVLPFVRRPEELDVWSAEFFLEIARRVVPVDR